MKMIKVKNLPSLVGREMEKELRFKKIENLASRREMVGPVAEYFYADPHNQRTEITCGEIAERGITFEPGHPDTRVRVLIRPDTYRDTAIEALYVIIKVLCERKEADWSKELKESLGLAAFQLELNYTVE
jgi:hypothetical protein